MAWAPPGSPRGQFFQQHLVQPTTDVVCVTEGFADLLPAHGDVIEADADYGYPLHAGRRKVLLWSRTSWHEVDAVGDPSLPGGRFVAGTTSTTVGEVRCVGVCVPWRDAHVRTGRRDRTPWADHVLYLEHLRTVLDRRRDMPTVVLGDFNQRVPRARQPAPVFDALTTALTGFTFATAGPITGTAELSIDHVATTRELAARTVRHLPSRTDEGRQMSDHFGLEVTLGHVDTPRSADHDGVLAP